MTKDKLTTLPLDLIETDSRLQVRTSKMLSTYSQAAKQVRLDDQHDRIVHVIESGSNLKAIEVIQHKGSYLVFDGHHRLKAYRDAYPLDNPEVPVVILPLTYREALAQGYTVNMDHGEGLDATERSQSSLRSCVYSSTKIKAKDLQQAAGFSLSLAQKITRAAKLLKEEAEIVSTDTPRTIDEKVSQWCQKQPPQCYGSDKRPLFKIDDHGFPNYRFVLERKHTRDTTSDAQKVERMVKTLEGLVDDDWDIFREALRKVARKTNRDLNITVHRVEESKEPEDNDSEEFEAIESVV